MVLHPVLTEIAYTAGARWGHGHQLPDLKVIDTSAHSLNMSRDFVAKYHRFLELDCSNSAVLEIVQIRPTDAAIGHSNQDFAGAGLWHGAIFDPKIFCGVYDDRFHEAALFVDGDAETGSSRVKHRWFPCVPEWLCRKVTSRECAVNGGSKLGNTMSDLFSLDGRRALITGSSQGIGFALAKGLAIAGAEIVLNGRDAGKLDKAAEILRGAGATVQTLVFDVTDHDAVRSAVDTFEVDHGRIDILVNNAGMQHRTALEDFPADAFEKLLQTNIASVFHVGQAVARHMIGRGDGKVINIASVQTALARPGIAPYTATKGAVANLTKGMATDWAQHGLQCNAIAPGYFDTPLNAALVADPEFSAWLEKRTPAGRWGNVDELVGACVFLSSKASSFVNGHTLYVDGGITASL